MNRKGLTPVIGAVLLLGISVAATGSAFVFLQSIQENVQQNSQDKVSEDRRQIQSSMNIENGYKGSQGHIIINVRNTGERSLEIQQPNGDRLWNIYIEGRPLSDDSTSWEFLNSKSGQVYIDPKNMIPINTTEPFPSNGNSKLVRITGTYETSDTMNCFNSGGNFC
ncbi:MAG: hypothetical protein H8Z69_00415 [Nanohaloarchaea archaeon]|nr:hypothetical protein [Candidatus Nanohaloarchaea archaeon]